MTNIMQLIVYSKYEIFMMLFILVRQNREEKTSLRSTVQIREMGKEWRVGAEKILASLAEAN
jgi:hypothetical protein